MRNDVVTRTTVGSLYDKLQNDKEWMEDSLVDKVYLRARGLVPWDVIPKDRRTENGALVLECGKESMLTGMVRKASVIP
jgi:hypothetical protein